MKFQKNIVIKFEMFDNNFIIYSRANFFEKDGQISAYRGWSEKTKLFDYRLDYLQTPKNIWPEMYMIRRATNATHTRLWINIQRGRNRMVDINRERKTEALLFSSKKEREKDKSLRRSLWREFFAVRNSLKCPI